METEVVDFTGGAVRVTEQVRGEVVDFTGGAVRVAEQARGDEC